jgi:hypothetical protein
MSRNVTVSIALAVAVLTVTGTSRTSQKDTQGSEEHEAWSQAVAANTVDAIDKYLSRYPAGKFAARVRIHREELLQDLKRRQQDRAIIDSILKHPSQEERAIIPSERLGRQYNLWRKVAYDRARVQFESAPAGQQIESQGSPGLRDWPPELKAGSVNFCLFRFMGEIIVPGCVVRILDGDGCIMPAAFLGGIPDEFKAVLPPLGAGSVHIFKGKGEIFGLQFFGDPNDPLRLLIDKEGAYIYIGGRGTLKTATGPVIFSNVEANKEPMSSSH